MIFPPAKADALTDNEEVNENEGRLGNILPNNVAESIEADTNCDFESTSKLLQFTAKYHLPLIPIRMDKTVSIFSRLSKYGKIWIEFCPYTGKYGSQKVNIAPCFTQ